MKHLVVLALAALLMGCTVQVQPGSYAYTTGAAGESYGGYDTTCNAVLPECMGPDGVWYAVDSLPTGGYVIENGYRLYPRADVDFGVRRPAALYRQQMLREHAFGERGEFYGQQLRERSFGEQAVPRQQVFQQPFRPDVRQSYGMPAGRPMLRAPFQPRMVRQGPERAPARSSGCRDCR